MANIYNTYLHKVISPFKLRHLKLYKVIKRNKKHYLHTYFEGENVDKIPFSSTGTCRAGGFYFTDYLNVPLYINYGELIADVTLSDDAKVYVEKDKFKADKIIISNIRSLDKFFSDFNYPKLHAVKLNGKILKYFKKQTEDICLEAVRQDGFALKYVKNQTEEICLEAVKQNSYTIPFVKKQTEKICLEAVKQAQHILKYVEKPNKEICLEAVREDGYNLRHVENQTEEICIEAVKQNGYVLKFVKNQTPKIYLEAVKQNPVAERHIRIVIDF